MIQPKYDGASSFTPSGIAEVSINGKTGCVDAYGKEIIGLEYLGIEIIPRYGLVKVTSWNRGKHGLMDLDGKSIVPPVYDTMNSFAENGLAAVHIADQWGYINAQGEVVISLRFDSAAQFGSNGLARVELDGQSGYVDERGVSTFD